MAAEKGNQYWKKRSKHGRDRVIKDPKVLADAADEYFQYCLDNPILQVDYKSTKKGLEKVHLPHPTVFQKNELARFVGLADWRGIADLKNVKDKELAKDYLKVITYIEGVIADQKYKYAVVNMFNSNIVARDLGLKDKSEIENKHGLSEEGEKQILKYLGRKNESKK